MSLANNAEGGTSGVTPATSDTGSGDPWTLVTAGPNSILDYSNVAYAHGLLSYQYANHSATAEQNFLSWTNLSPLANGFGRLFVMVSATPTVITPVMRFFSGGTTIGTLNLTTGRKIQFVSGLGGTQFTSATALTANAWYRVEWNAIFNATATGTLQIRLYLGDVTSPLEDSGQVNNPLTTSIATCSMVRYGFVSAVANAPTATDFLYLDDLVAFATMWPGVLSGGFLAPSATLVSAA